MVLFLYIDIFKKTQHNKVISVQIGIRGVLIQSSIHLKQEAITIAINQDLISIRSDSLLITHY